MRVAVLAVMMALALQYAGAAELSGATAQADALLRRIARAGAEAQPLDRARAEDLAGVRTDEQCGDYEDPQGHIDWCKYLPAEPQPGPIRFVAYETSRLGLGAMTGGHAEWAFDRAAFCLKGAAVQQALGVTAEYARQPVMPDLLAFADPKQVDGMASYDFTLLRRPGEGRLARFRDNYLAVVEEGGCVDRISLSTYAMPAE